jgi:DNA-binding NtrC family response regulator
MVLSNRGQTWEVETMLKQVLVADDEETIRRLLEYNLRKIGFEPLLAATGLAAIELASDELACALVDLKMPEADGMAVLAHFKKKCPEVPVLMISAAGQTRDAVAAMKQGALEYISKPFDLDELLALVVSAAKMSTALRNGRQLRDSVARPPLEDEFIGTSGIANKLVETVKRIAALDSTVLITGETGVGKGLLARMIHRFSKRADGPFITTSCPALPRELLESEMFGHEKGAFTGAHQRRLGRIEMAEGGTLFLDEIGDLPLLLQPKILNVLQDRQFQRVGGGQVIHTNIRLVAATNVSLREKVSSKEFREDLFYRLNVISIHIPSLRERKEDIDALARRILARLAARRGGEGFRLDPEALNRLLAYPWPGNVRELENVLERASAFCTGHVIHTNDFPEEITCFPQHAGSFHAGHRELELGGVPLDKLERMALVQTLKLCGGNKAKAARSLGITEKTIYNMIARYGLLGEISGRE